MDINLIGNTIYLDTDSKVSIEKNLHRSCKKAIRKAEKLNLKLKIDENGRNLDEFIEVYTETMRNNNANKYYLFSKSYFNDLFKLLRDRIKIFSTTLNGKITASCLVLIGKEYFHAHLAGSNGLGYETSSMNYIYYKIAKWGAENGFKKLHLGGGYKGDEGSLYKFKKTFNVNDQLEFYIGKNIHDEEIYKKLNDKYEEKNKNKINSNLNYFPLYRR